MPGADRVLIEIMTFANTAGITKAQRGFVGLIGNVALASVAIGGIYELTTDMIKITEEHSKAEDNLRGAIVSRGGSQKQVQSSLASFMQTNRDFISNQSEVINSYAALFREGVKAKDLSRLMTIALHIQAAEGGTLAEAVGKVQQAEVGRNRGLTTAVGLGLESIKTTDTLAEKHAKVARNLAKVEKAYKDIKLTPLEVASNHLNTAWEDLAERSGPILVGVLGQLTQGAADFLKALGDPKSYVGINDFLVGVAGKLRDIALQLGIAEPAKPPADTAEQELIAHSTPEQKARRLAALGKGPAAYAAEIKRQEAEQAKQLKAIADRIAKGDRDSLKYLMLINEDTRQTAINTKLGRNITVVFSASDLAAQLRKRDRSLR